MIEHVAARAILLYMFIYHIRGMTMIDLLTTHITGFVRSPEYTIHMCRDFLLRLFHLNHRYERSTQ